MECLSTLERERSHARALIIMCPGEVICRSIDIDNVVAAAAGNGVAAIRRFNVESIVALATLECRIRASGAVKPELRTVGPGLLEVIALLTSDGVVAATADKGVVIQGTAI